MITDHHSVLGQGFVSASTDFWTDSHRKQQFDALVINMIAEKYFVEDMARWLFMSHVTAASMGKKSVSNLFDDVVDHSYYRTQQLLTI